MASTLGLLDLPSSPIYWNAHRRGPGFAQQCLGGRREAGHSVLDLGPALTLMLVSRAIHTEVNRLLSFYNRVFVQDRAPLELVSVKYLGSLRGLFPEMLLFVISLVVRLYVTIRKRDASYAIWCRWSLGGCCFQGTPCPLT